MGEISFVDDGVKGDVVEGVRRLLRCVEIVSSSVLRESRRKVRKASGWKQNCGVKVGGEGG